MEQNINKLMLEVRDGENREFSPRVSRLYSEKYNSNLNSFDDHINDFLIYWKDAHVFYTAWKPKIS